MHSEAMERLRESFSEIRSAKQEEFYGLYTQYFGRYIRRAGFVTQQRETMCTISWRNAFTGESGVIAEVENAELIEALMMLLSELRRLREVRPMRRAA